MVFFLLSCSKKEHQEYASINVNFIGNSKRVLKKINPKIQVSEPTTNSDINCYGLLVNESIPQTTLGTCTVNSINFTVTQVGGLSFLSGSGNVNIVLNNLAVGSSVDLKVLGFTTSSASHCLDFNTNSLSSFSPGSTNVSEGYVLTETSFFVEKDATIDITINSSASILSSQKVTSCLFKEGSKWDEGAWDQGTWGP